MPDWNERESNIFSIDADDSESSNLLRTPKLSQRSIQRAAPSTAQSPARAFTSRQPLLSPDPESPGKKQLHSPLTAIEMQSAEEKIRYATSSGQAPVKQSFIDRLLGRPEPACARTFNIGSGEESLAVFPANIIRNQKYHPSTLILVVLYNQVISRTGTEEHVNSLF
jgi:hypothetical protein